jgi:DNA-binding transcriptional ArsR family regulator
MSDAISEQSVLRLTSVQGSTEQRAKIFAALSDPTRLRIVEMLMERDEMSGSELANQLGISLALFCHHSKTLCEAGVVHIRRAGQTKYHSLNLDQLANCFGSFREIENVKDGSL